MPKRDRTETSRALVLLREAANLYQEEAAAAAGIQPGTLSDYERGKDSPSEERLREIAGCWELSPGHVDEALALVRSVDRLRCGPGDPADPGPRVLRRIEEIVAGAAAAVAAFLRDRLLGGFRRDVQRAAHEEALELWARLKAYLPEEREALVRQGATFRHWGLCVLLCDQSVEAAADDAGRAVELARLAVLVAEHAPGGERWRRELQAYAALFLGNAVRVHGRLREADVEFARAEALLEPAGEITSDLLDGTRQLDLKASLRIEQERFAEAIGLLDRALEKIGPGRRAGRLLIIKAYALELSGDAESSLSALREAARWVDRRLQPRQHFALLFNELTTLCKLGRHTEAQAGLGRVKALALALDTELDRVRLRWLQATVASGLGRIAEAVAALDEVRRFFASRGIPFDAALATLELSMLYLGTGHPAKVRELAREAVVVFERHGAHPHALAALRVFAAAAERQQATAALASKLIAYLQRARRMPDLRFEA
jgi:transcriptional regulator with XRE-family HTH domain